FAPAPFRSAARPYRPPSDSAAIFASATSPARGATPDRGGGATVRVRTDPRSHAALLMRGGGAIGLQVRLQTRDLFLELRFGVGDVALQMVPDVDAQQTAGIAHQPLDMLERELMRAL